MARAGETPSARLDLRESLGLRERRPEGAVSSGATEDIPESERERAEGFLAATG